jgi:hypothetical protein
MTTSKRRDILATVGVLVAVAVVAAAVRATLWWRLQMVSPLTMRYAMLAAVAAVIALLRALQTRLRWSLCECVAVVAIGLAGGLWFGRTLAAVAGNRPMPPAEHSCMVHLFGVVADRTSPDDPGGSVGMTVAVVDRSRVPDAAARVREAIASRSGGSVVILGGPQTKLVDETCRRAVRWLPEIQGGNATIVLVTPEPISDNTRQVLEDKGLETIEIEHEFPNHL